MENIFGTRLKELRTKLRLSQTDFAKEIGATQNSLYLYETGKRIPSLEVAIKIAERTGTSIDWLCGKSTRMTSWIDNPSEILNLVSESIVMNGLNVDETIGCTCAALEMMPDSWEKVLSLHREANMSRDLCISTLQKMNEETFDESYFEMQFGIAGKIDSNIESEE
ncbi:helix-turn-helix transcriptional regulator [Eubacterium aggregans]|uniref:helix-turn-helix transcriptional regulator n=1 Tax=Eubacterium aggregans TaxID=81409 RepID=UPI003F3F516B